LQTALAGLGRPIVMLGRAAAASLLALCCAGTAQAAERAGACGSSAVDVHVAFAPGVVKVDEGKSSRELQKTGQPSSAVHQLGITRATPQRTIQVQWDERDPCARPKITLELTVRPLLVELASELKDSPCLHKYVLDHEMQHIAILHAAMNKAAVELEKEMRAQVTAPRDRNVRESARELHAQVGERWLPRLDMLVAQSNAEQEALDVGQETRAAQACRTEVAQVLRTVR
jgi:hypothetical protein